MTLEQDFDVVVVGFGVAGAAAAVEAAHAGARVLVLDRRGVVARYRTGRFAPVAADELAVLVRRRFGTSTRRVESRRGALRAAALAAGVEVRVYTAVHELLVEGGRVTGVGCATMNPLTCSGAGYWGLQRLGTWAPKLSATLGWAIARAAESLWQEASLVQEVRSPAVILGMDRKHWDFVGPAVWAASSAVERLRTRTYSKARQRLSLTEGSAVQSPELRVRAWCVAKAREVRATPPAELTVDSDSGLIGVGAGSEVRGLYAVVPDSRAYGAGPAERLAAAGGRTGRAAAAESRRAVGHLTLVG